MQAVGLQEAKKREVSQQCQCQTYAVSPHEANPCSGPAQRMPMGMVLPSAEMLLKQSLYPSFSATGALRHGTQSWAQLPCGALHPPTPLAAAAQHWGAEQLGQPDPHTCGVSESTLPGPCRLCSG